MKKKTGTQAHFAAIGIDLGDVWGHYCSIDQEGNVVEEGRVKMTRRAMSEHFADLPLTRIAIEAGTHSLWVSEHLSEMGHEVFVANVRELRAITDSDRKHDRADAEKLARYARVDPRILRPIQHRSSLTHADLVFVRSRAVLVEARTRLSNTARSLVKPFGLRLPPLSVSGYAKKALDRLPENLNLGGRLKTGHRWTLKTGQRSGTRTRVFIPCNGSFGQTFFRETARRVYTGLTWAEDTATQGCDRRADSAVGMAGRRKPPFWLHSGGKAINPRGLGTESPSNTDPFRIAIRSRTEPLRLLPCKPCSLRAASMLERRMQTVGLRLLQVSGKCPSPRSTKESHSYRSKESSIRK